MTKNILWCTSFAKDMWKSSGLPLIRSFHDSKSDGKMFVGYEKMASYELAEASSASEMDRVVAYDVGEDRFLRDFLEANRDVIPTHMGGDHKFPECVCKGGPFGPHDKKHKMPCPGHWFNKNFSRWFRKVATMKAAVDMFPETDVLIWIDADCFFKRDVNAKRIITEWFKLTYSVFYFKNKRPVIETGLVGYWLPNGGRKVLDALIGRYASGNFRKDHRWDDSWQTQMALADTKALAVDLATKVGEHAAVVEHSIVGKYIGHDKGRHGRKLGIMK